MDVPGGGDCRGIRSVLLLPTDHEHEPDVHHECGDREQDEERPNKDDENLAPLLAIVTHAVILIADAGRSRSDLRES